MPVTGIGGLFFRAKDPDALARWYRDHLGVAFRDGAPWRQEAGATAFMPFPDGSDYFAADRRWMVNFRVTDLDGLLAGLERAGIAVRTDPEWDGAGLGRFARVHDPEGNPVELWEPPAA